MLADRLTADAISPDSYRDLSPVGLTMMGVDGWQRSWMLKAGEAICSSKRPTFTIDHSPFTKYLAVLSSPFSGTGDIDHLLLTIDGFHLLFLFADLNGEQGDSETKKA